MHLDKVRNFLITVSICQSKSEEMGDALIENVKSKICVADYSLRQCIHVIINELFTQESWYKIKTVAPYNNQSLHAEHGINSLSILLPNHMTGLSQM